MTRRLRDALGCFPTGVAVITTASRTGEKIGITVNSFSSVSLTPPLVSWCLSRDSGLVGHFRKGTPFAVNVLAKGQKDLALRFARPGKNRFTNIRAWTGQNGAPVLAGRAALFACTTEAVHGAGDHVIIIGRIDRFAAAKKLPLLFHRGRFRGLSGGTP
ncbi:MAG TPA: flavin reductase family protein [Sphingomonadales bacterium]|nr:flavin reductase family protein [Sphingomonadales bacterium]